MFSGNVTSPDTSGLAEEFAEDKDVFFLGDTAAFLHHVVELGHVRSEETEETGPENVSYRATLGRVSGGSTPSYEHEHEHGL